MRNLYSIYDAFGPSSSAELFSMFIIHPWSDLLQYLSRYLI